MATLMYNDRGYEMTVRQKTGEKLEVYRPGGTCDRFLCGVFSQAVFFLFVKAFKENAPLICIMAAGAGWWNNNVQTQTEFQESCN